MPNKYFGFPFIIFFALVVGTLLFVPALDLPFLMDDYLFLNKLQESDGSDLDLYKFIHEDIPSNDHYSNQINPWWTNPFVKLAFWRPLSSFLLMLDNHFFHLNPLWSHLHSILWFIALLAAFGVLYRKILPSAIGALALVLCTLDHAYALPAAWAPNRHALVAAVPIFWALWAHIHWREEQWNKGLYLSMIGYTLGLLGGENALSALAYVVAYEMFGSADRLKKRFQCLLPVLLIGVIYIGVYRGLGYGTTGSDFYIDPVGQFPAYLRAAAMRIPALCADLVLGIPADLWLLSYQLRVGLIICGFIALALLAYFAKLCVGQLREHKEFRALRWLCIGAFLSLFPVVATAPTTRQLVCPVFGFSAILAALIYQSWKAWSGTFTLNYVQKILLVSFSGWLLFVHMIIAPAQTLIFQMRHLKNVAQLSQELVLSLRAEDLEDKDIIVLPSHDIIINYFLHPMHYFHNDDHPRSFNILSMAPYAHKITRVDAHTLELELVNGQMLQEPLETFLYSSENPLAVGDSVDVGIFIATVEAMDQGPTKVKFKFQKPLDDPSYVFLHWNGSMLEKKTIPEANQSLLLPKTRGPLGM